MNKRNPISPKTENVLVAGRTVMVVTVEEGVDKPYFGNQFTATVPLPPN